MSEEKLPWGLKQSAPGSMKTLTKDKIEAFEQGIMNIPNKKHLSKKELEELKKKQEEQEAAALIRDFEASFAESNKGVKTFVKGSTFNAGSREEKFVDKGAYYKPTSKLHEKLLNPRTQAKAIEKKENESQKSKIVNIQDKKRSNLELFKEELKRIQEEREARHKNRQNVPEEAKIQTPKADIKNETSIELQNSNKIVDDNITTNIFLSNLNSNANEKELMEKFGKYGPLASVKIMWPRSEEDKLRGANCGFVAFMCRKDAEQALKDLDGYSIDGVPLRLSWSKAVTIPPHPIYIPPHLLEVTVPPPPSGLPFNAQPQKSDIDYLNRNLNEEQINNVLENATVKVTIPTERPLLCLIHRMIEFVVKEGPEFEALIMAKEINNPQFRFLFDNQSQSHIYYRWKLFSILQGDSVSDWYDGSFQMFKDGSYWIPPVLNSYTKGESDESYEKARRELEQKKGRLSNENRDKLEDILRGLTTERSTIGNAMIFCIDHADCAEEIVDCIIESLSILHTPINKKVARLFLVSDILHNCHVKVANASFYRKGFEKHLQELFKHLNSILFGIEGKMKSEIFKNKVLNCIKAWQDLAIYPFDYISQLQNTFLGHFKNMDSNNNNNNNNNSNDDIDKFNQNTNSNSNLISSIYDEDIDGKPLDDVKTYDDSNYENIDGKPLNDYDEDIDGKPLSDSEENNQKSVNTGSKFIASKWEEVDPEQLEKQAVTTSKWDFFDDNQSDKNTNDDSRDTDEQDINYKKIKEIVPQVESNQQQQQQQQQQEPIVSKSESLFQQYSQQKEQLSEEKRQILRDIEVQAVKYQDDLELGHVERNHNISSQQQVENYRNYLLKKKFENLSQKNSNSNNKNNNNSNSSNSSSNRHHESSQQRRKSRTRSRTRSRSRSPSNRYKSSNSSYKKSRQRSRSRSRSNSPSRRYKKKR